MLDDWRVLWPKDGHLGSWVCDVWDIDSGSAISWEKWARLSALNPQGAWNSTEISSWEVCPAFDPHDIWFPSTEFCRVWRPAIARIKRCHRFIIPAASIWPGAQNQRRRCAAPCILSWILGYGKCCPESESESFKGCAAPKSSTLAQNPVKIFGIVGQQLLAAGTQSDEWNARPINKL